METGVTSLAFFSTGENVCFSADSDKNNAQKEFRLCGSLLKVLCAFYHSCICPQPHLILSKATILHWC